MWWSRTYILGIDDGVGFVGLDWNLYGILGFSSFHSSNSYKFIIDMWTWAVNIESDWELIDRKSNLFLDTCIKIHKWRWEVRVSNLHNDPMPPCWCNNFIFWQFDISLIIAACSLFTSFHFIFRFKLMLRLLWLV
jgi:hypothetical protein